MGMEVENVQFNARSCFLLLKPIYNAMRNVKSARTSFHLSNSNYTPTPPIINKSHNICLIFYFMKEIENVDKIYIYIFYFCI